MRADILERKEEILQWIAEGKSKAQMARDLGCNPKTINPVLTRLGIEYKGNPGGKGLSKPNGREMTLLQYLEHSADIQSNKVRKKLLDEGYKQHQCESCGLTEWLEEPIPLELHHKDGNRFNNTLENFQLLCPNCHARTDSYRGKNCSK
jgi:5-methylcytosine-specific restriction endonuclease McrA